MVKTSRHYGLEQTGRDKHEEAMDSTFVRAVESPALQMQSHSTMTVMSLGPTYSSAQRLHLLCSYLIKELN